MMDVGRCSVSHPIREASVLGAYSAYRWVSLGCKFSFVAVQKALEFYF